MSGAFAMHAFLLSIAAVLVPAAACAQHLEVVPQHVAVGGDAVVHAFDAAARPLAALAVRVRDPGGTEHALGVTDAAGTVRYRPSQAGAHSVRAELAASAGQPPVLLLVGLDVAPAPRRWAAALFWVPVALLLLWAQARRRGATE